jgi:hypothetical protein
MARGKLPLAGSYDQAVSAITEADAVARARELVRLARDEKIEWCGLPLSWLDKRDNRASMRALLERFAVASPNVMMDLPHLARAGWGLAHEVLLSLHVQYEHAGKPRPPPLAAYVMEIAAGRIPLQVPSKKVEDNFMRRVAICCVVGLVCQEFKLKPTRSGRTRPGRDRPSGCSVTAQAMRAERLALSEAAVVKIWQQIGRVAFPHLTAKVNK